MSEAEHPAGTETSSPPPKKSWLKTIWGTAAGLVSAAVMAWVSPLVTNVAKPSKPVANFGAQHKGLDVTFKNESLGASKCRWDFGDGSPLEFVAGSQATVEHTYEKADLYDVKLVVSNILGEENERVVKLDLRTNAPVAAGPAGSTGQPPAILDFYARAPRSAGGAPVYAPATYRFQAVVENASQVSWDFGDGSAHQLGNPEATHTFSAPGDYSVKLCVYNGGQKTEKDYTVSVAAPPTGAITCRLAIIDQGVPVDVQKQLRRISKATTINGARGPTTTEAVYTAVKGFQITNFEPKENRSTPNVQKIDYQLAPDRSSLKVIARLAPSSEPADAVLNQAVLVEETRKGKASVHTHTPISGTLTAPGNTILALPPTPENFTGISRQMSLELWHKGAPIWRGNALPRGVPLNFDGYSYTLSAVQNGDKVEIQLSRPGAGEPQRSSFNR